MHGHPNIYHDARSPEHLSRCTLTRTFITMHGHPNIYHDARSPERQMCWIENARKKDVVTFCVLHVEFVWSYCCTKHLFNRCCLAGAGENYLGNVEIKPFFRPSQPSSRHKERRPGTVTIGQGDGTSELWQGNGKARLEVALYIILY